MTCPACGAEAASDARFCASCGRAFRSADDERRVVTILFADLVGFTSLSERMDPERVKNLVDRCFDRLAADVVAFGGQVDKVVGDALIALFGAPVAHEDDAERAVRAALRMQASLDDEVAELGHDLRMRIGVNTGEVLVGAMRAAGSITAMGDVVNTASRLQTAAQPGQVLVGASTHAGTQHAIAYEARGLLAAKGREEPVDTWVALAPTAVPGSRLRRVDLPLVGREHELAVLRHAVDLSIIGERPLLAVLIGDVGMGKSRLADEVASWAERTHGTLTRVGRCVPYGEANVWWPVADALRDGLGGVDGQPLDAARASVAERVALALGHPERHPEVTRTTDGLLALLGHEITPDADPATVRQDAGRALTVYADHLARIQPLVLEFSDLHWADDAVLTLIDDMFDTLGHRPIVVIATARPALLDRWNPRPGRHNAMVVHVDALDRASSQDLLEQLVGEEVPQDVAEVLLDRSGGNPFYLEELVNLLDGAVVPAGTDGLPDTLRGLVAARLDDLSATARAVLQNASVIGQRGPTSGLREMGRSMDRGVEVDHGLAELVEEEVMEVSGEQWSFRSDLVREVAYQTITKADRARSHLGIARHLETEVAVRQPRPAWVVDQLAHHYGAAVALAEELGPVGRTASFPPGLSDHARRWVVEAAERARRDQAMPTAVRLYGQALSLLGPDADPREAVELHLARADAATEAWDMGVAREEQALAATAADGHFADLVARALVVRGRIEQREGEVDLAVASLSEAIDHYEASGDMGGRADALRQRGMVEIFGGRLDDADRSARAALAAFEQVGDRGGQAWALQNMAWIAFTTGRVDDAARNVEAALAMFSELVDGRGMAWSLGLLAWIRFQQRRVVEAAALGEQVLQEARNRNDPWATGMMTLLMAGVRLWSGRTSEAVDLAGEARRRFESIGDNYGHGQAGAVLGRALVMVGRVEEGFALLGSFGPLGASADQRAGRLTRVAAAAQVGQPELAGLDELDLGELGEFGADDGRVVLAVLALQRGDRAEAERLLRPNETTGDPNLLAALALLAAATGEGDARALAERVAGVESATYLDLATAQIAAALEASARLGEGDAEAAQRRAVAACEAVDATGDRVARAVMGMLAAAVAARLGGAEADELVAQAEDRIRALGLNPVGWRKIVDLTAAPVPALHSA